MSKPISAVFSDAALMAWLQRYYPLPGVTPATTPAGSNTQVQYNNSGDFGASSDFTFDGTDVSIANDLYVGRDIAHVGDTSTKIRFSSGTQVYDCLGSQRLRLDSHGAGFNGASATGHYALTLTGSMELNGDIRVGGGDVILGQATSYIKDSGNVNRIKIDADYLYLNDNGGNAEFYVTDGECKVYNDLEVGAGIDAATLTLGDGDLADGDTLLTFNTDRAWAFKQAGNASSADLMLQNTNGPNKDFIIQTNGITRFYNNSGVQKAQIDNGSGDITGSGNFVIHQHITGTSGTSTIITNNGGGYIEAKSNHATYGLIIRDYNGALWANITTNNGLLQLAYNTNSTTAGIFLNDSDNVGIGDSTPSYKLDVAGTIRATGDLRASGDVRTTDDAVIGDDIWSNGVGSGTGNTAVFSSNKLKYISSTRKIKNDIESITTSQLDKILALRPVTFELKSDPGPRHMGMVAEEAFEVDPFFAIVGEDFDYDESGQRKRNIYTDENGEVVKERIILSDALVPNDWNTRAVTAALVKAVQELKAENDALKIRVDQLENV